MFYNNKWFVLLLIILIVVDNIETVCKHNEQNNRHLLCQIKNGEEFIVHNNRNNNKYKRETTDDLEKLSVDFPDLESIYVNTLENVTEIKELKITSNHVKRIQFGAFDKLNDLIHLDLSNNKIEILEPGVFDLLNNLEILNLYGNKLEQLPEDMFLQLFSLKTLDLGANSLAELPEETFKTEQLMGSVTFQSSIQTLILSDNPFKKLTKLLYLDNLKSLNLANANLRDNIEPDAFQNYPSLELLYLQSNNISKITHIDWSKLRSLRELNLSKNKLHKIDGTMFKSMKQLQDLDLSDNRISSITSEMFNFTLYLRHLLLANNDISKVDGLVLNQMKRLKELNLAGNNISEIDSGGFSNAPLIKLDLSRNKLSKFKFGTFDSMRYTRAVTTSRLLWLNLTDNGISELSVSAFEPLKNLNALYLSRNNISQVPENLFKSMPKLQILHLDHNRIAELPDDVFKPIRGSLTKLDLQYNEITHARCEIFSLLHKLTELNFMGNKLMRVDEGVLNIPNLKTIVLTNNQIKYLPTDLLKGDNCHLENLYISNNRLTFIEDAFFENVNLKNFTFGRNPWLCKCLEQMVETLNRHNIHFDATYASGQQPACVIDKNKTCVQDINANDRLYNEYNLVMSQYPKLCKDPFYC